MAEILANGKLASAAGSIAHDLLQQDGFRPHYGRSRYASRVAASNSAQ